MNLVNWMNRIELDSGKKLNIARFKEYLFYIPPIDCEGSVFVFMRVWMGGGSGIHYSLKI